MSEIAERTDTDQFRYVAFISYSHIDKRWADWLQPQLENYRVPDGVVVSAAGKAPLAPVFRDKTDLSSSSSLTDAVTNAIKDSNALIVICSPNAASSHWVNQEILLFKQIHGDARVFPVIVAGEPFAADARNECFPPALRFDVDHSGDLTSHRVEPLAVNLLPSGDGRRDGSLKLIAGLLGVHFDDLQRRQYKRQQRRFLIATTGALIIASVMTGVAVYALLAKRDAEFRRAQAEDLIGFMLGDLRKRLEPLGRLDVLDEVGDMAMSYFASLPASDWDEKVLLQRGKALRQIGEVKKSQGNLSAATEAFFESNRLLSIASQQSAANTEVQFELAQSHFWIADVYLEQDRVMEAEREIETYRDLVLKLTLSHPDNQKYWLEYSYAESNLGTLAFKSQDLKTAKQRFTAAHKVVSSLVEENPDDVDLTSMLAVTSSWLGTVEKKLLNLDAAFDWHSQALELRRRIADQGQDKAAVIRLGSILRIVADDYYLRGGLKEAMVLNREAVALFTELVTHDSENLDWQRRLHAAKDDVARNHIALGQLDEAGLRLQITNAAYEKLLPIMASEKLEKDRVVNLLFQAGVALGQADFQTALSNLDGTQPLVDALSNPHRLTLSINLALLRSEGLRMKGNADLADRVARDAYSAFSTIENNDLEFKVSLAALAQISGRDQKAFTIFRERNFRVPVFWSQTQAGLLLSEMDP